MKVLIADDEPLALRKLEASLACIPEVELVGAAKNGSEALALIRSLRPEVVILDINMPGKDGIGVVEAVGRGEQLPEFIFITAFAEYAIKAFELCAVDYLTKPVRFERLRAALDNAQGRLQAKSARKRFADLEALIAVLQDQGSASGHDEHVWVRLKDSMVRLPTSEIDYVKALGDYVDIFAGEAVHPLRESISVMEKRLDPKQFVRCHRSCIVNIQSVKAFKRAPAGKVNLVMTSGTILTVGPLYLDATLQALKAKRWRSHQVD